MPDHILAIDQGTTSSRAIVYDSRLRPVASAQQEFKQYFPAAGWVEHDPEEIWESVVACCRRVLKKADLAASAIAGIGITNQRETTLLWDRQTGKPLGRAIVWQDRRTAGQCEVLRQSGIESLVRARTGLLLDPYFSGTKLAWMLDNIAGARRLAEEGRVAFGTMDTFLIWRLTGGVRHVTDATNASRTLLYNIRTGDWDRELCKALSVPISVLPEVEDCAAEFGTCEPDLFGGAIPIRGVAGDQQAAVVGQGCFRPGMVKSTYGTGCFVLINTGDRCVLSENNLISTIAYRLAGKTAYALEGSIFMGGAVVQWLRDELKIIESASEVGDLAAKSNPDIDVYMVPAFVGLGAPWWDADARGTIFGLTRNAGRPELARAALEAVCFQTYDLINAMQKDWGAEGRETILRVDGGMAASDWTMQRLADTLGTSVERPANLETTALGAAWLAGFQAGLWSEAGPAVSDAETTTRFAPEWDDETRQRRIGGWHEAVRRTLVQRG
jgi:glycerol kinase